MIGSSFESQTIQTLEFWQQVEFFTPYDLDQLSGDAVFRLTREELEQPDANKLLAWLGSSSDSAHDPYEFERGELYLGVFNSEDIKQICQKNLGDQNTAEPFGVPHHTCFAKLRVNSQGWPDFEAMSCSTLPWALGRLEQDAANEISLENFVRSRQDLVQKLRKSYQEQALQPADLARIADILFSWTGFYPQEQSLLVMREFWRKRCTETLKYQSESGYKADRVEKLNEEAECAAENIILNSAYLQDLHGAKALAAAGHASVALNRYLSPEDIGARVDVFQPEQAAVICDVLQPHCTNRSRWADEADRCTNLSQQLAINLALTEPAEGGLHSLTARLETGELVVLKELIAENLARRAAVLARFDQPEDAFQGRAEVVFHEKAEHCIVPLLNPALTGYEMVIAAPNEKALTTIYQELQCSYRQHCIANCEPSDFQTAKAEFKQAKARIDEQFAELNELAEYQFSLRSEEQYCQAEWERLRAAKAVLESIVTAQRACETQLSYLKYDLGRLEREAELLKWKEPNWWKRAAFWLEENATHKKLALRNAEDQGSLRQRIMAEERDRESNPAYQSGKAHSDVEQAEQQLQARQAEFQHKKERRTTLRERWNIRLCPGSFDAPEIIHDQEQFFWQHAELNQSRSKFFQAALRLHQAWLAHISKQTDFNGSMEIAEKLNAGCQPANSEHTLAAWQWSFMTTPLISCALKHFHSRFRSLPPQSLGWLFVHDGDQAPPQAAVGALCRTKRVLVMGGDPHSANKDPQTVSVKTLADRANRFGTVMESEKGELWIGTPLAINRAADQNELIVRLNECRWFDVRGLACDRQYVQEQGAFVMNKISSLYAENNNKLPAICILSPFRFIVRNLQILLRNPNEWNERVKAGRVPGRVELERWVESRIGLVEDFQGRSEESVFLVLGGNEDSEVRAASTPGILNTVLTCAKQRFYVVGDRELWQKQKHFSQLAALLQEQ